MSHHCASTLSRASPSESPGSKTSVGQPALWAGAGFVRYVCLLGGVRAKICGSSKRCQSALGPTRAQSKSLSKRKI